MCPTSNSAEKPQGQVVGVVVSSLFSCFFHHRKRTTKALNRLRGCAGWSVFLFWYATISGLEVIKLESILKRKIKRNECLLADTCPQAANLYALF